MPPLLPPSLPPVVRVNFPPPSPLHVASSNVLPSERARDQSSVQQACARRAGRTCTRCAAEGVQRAEGGGAPFKEQFTTCSGGYTGPKARDFGSRVESNHTGLHMRPRGLQMLLIQSQLLLSDPKVRPGCDHHASLGRLG